jgi:hypothetical protein
MSFEKAIIEVLDPPGSTTKIAVQFNPETYRLSKGAQIAEIGVYGLDSPILQFIRGQNETLTLELFFDTTHDGMGEDARDVRNLTDPFYRLIKIQRQTHAPPRVRFVWGVGISFKAIVEQVEQTFELFSPTGVPLRATLSVTFREYKTLEEQIAELKPESTDHTKQLTVRAGDTLPGLAWLEYGDPNLWRVIADANVDAVRDPLRPPAGAVLALPPLDVARLAAEVRP